MTSESRTTSGQTLLVADDRARLQRRWVEIEEWFADDPGDAVRRADSLIDDAIDHIRGALDAHRTQVRGRWETVDDATTEQLRATLHEYEQLLAQLSALPAPSGWHDRAHGGKPTAHGRTTFTRDADGDDAADDATDHATTSKE